MSGKELLAAYVVLLLLAGLVAWAIYHGIDLGPAQTN